MEWNSYEIKLYETPGHSPGSICILVNNEVLFTGDSLLKDFDVITRFPGGSKKKYSEITLPFLRGLDDNIMVFPGHGSSGRLGEIRG